MAESKDDMLKNRTRASDANPARRPGLEEPKFNFIQLELTATDCSAGKPKAR